MKMVCFHKVITVSFLSIILLLPHHSALGETNQRYLIYLHGSWPEKSGLNQSHPRHGQYQYHSIVNTFKREGFHVISELRSSTDPESYADYVADQIEHLREKGVSPKNIFVMGHSKGGGMALVVSSLWQSPDLRFIILAGCGKQGTRFHQNYRYILSEYGSGISGHILSIYDSSDRITSTCREAFNTSQATSTKEVVLKTGKGHGLFYSPSNIWVREVLKWVSSL